MRKVLPAWSCSAGCNAFVSERNASRSACVTLMALLFQHCLSDRRCASKGRAAAHDNLCWRLNNPFRRPDSTCYRGMTHVCQEHIVILHYKLACIAHRRTCRTRTRRTVQLIMAPRPSPLSRPWEMECATSTCPTTPPSTATCLSSSTTCHRREVFLGPSCEPRPVFSLLSPLHAPGLLSTPVREAADNTMRHMVNRCFARNIQRAPLHSSPHEGNVMLVEWVARLPSCASIKR